MFEVKVGVKGGPAITLVVERDSISAKKVLKQVGLLSSCSESSRIGVVELETKKEVTLDIEGIKNHRIKSDSLIAILRR